MINNLVNKSSNMHSEPQLVEIEYHNQHNQNRTDIVDKRQANGSTPPPFENISNYQGFKRVQSSNNQHLSFGNHVKQPFPSRSMTPMHGTSLAAESVPYINSSVEADFTEQLKNINLPINSPNSDVQYIDPEGLQLGYLQELKKLQQNQGMMGQIDINQIESHLNHQMSSPTAGETRCLSLNAT